MPDTPESLFQEMFARQALLIQLMRLLLRERASQNGQTERDILEWSEDTKRFFEERMPPGVAESYMTGAVDVFFNLLAAEVKADRENQK